MLSIDRKHTAFSSDVARPPAGFVVAAAVAGVILRLGAPARLHAARAARLLAAVTALLLATSAPALGIEAEPGPTAHSPAVSVRRSTAKPSGKEKGCGLAQTRGGHTAAKAKCAPKRKPPPPPGPQVQVVLTTANLTDALTTMAPLQFGHQPAAGARVLHVNDRVRYQTIMGFGGAMTDTSAWLIYDELAPAARAQLLSNLYSPAGIDLNIIRVPIGATDFTAMGIPYSYDDLPVGQSDPQLTNFSIAHDEAYIIPALQQLLQVNPTTHVLAGLWSPPPWMKANDAFNNNSFAGTLLPSLYGPLASYYVKFIQAYQAQGIPIDAITPQNEPRSNSSWPGMEFPVADEAQWLTQDLGPALAAAGLDPIIYGLDDSNLADAEAILASPAASMINGIAWHCYEGMGQISALQARYPAEPELLTECSPGIVPYSTAEIAIDATRNWASAVLLWNLALNPYGGPVQIPNYGCFNCTGIVTINELTGTTTYGQNYYQLGQLSKFVQPGAQRISTDRFVSDFVKGPLYGVTAGLDNVAFINPDGTKVLVAYNNTFSNRRFVVSWHSYTMPYTLPPLATVTLMWH
ncbi:MAG: glycoside hydrolase family 30 beta sandwich domain-containing protein [Solirubrobacteraceae bacterium]|jgi:glucosylceramidase